MRKTIPAIVCLGLLAGCTGNIQSKKAEKEPVKVRVETVALTVADVAKTYVGKVESATVISVKCPFPANLRELKTARGNKVEAGDILAEVYSENVESTLAVARASYNQATDGYNRLQKVKDNGSVSEVKIVEVETRLAQAEAMLKSACKAKEDCSIKAPLGGTVREIYVKTGEDLSLQQPVLSIIDLDRLEISISVPETEIAAIRTGDKACIVIPAISDRTFEGTVSSKGVAAQAVSHSYECKIALQNAPEGVMPGMMGKVRFISNSGTKAPVIPASAISSDKDGRYVWLVNDKGTVEKRHIVTDGFSGKGIIVKEGLEGGEKLVTQGFSKVCSGMKPVIE